MLEDGDEYGCVFWGGTEGGEVFMIGIDRLGAGFEKENRDR